MTSNLRDVCQPWARALLLAVCCATVLRGVEGQMKYAGKERIAGKIDISKASSVLKDVLLPRTVE